MYSEVSLETLPSYKQGIKDRSDFSTVNKKSYESFYKLLGAKKKKKIFELAAQECRLNTRLSVSMYGTKLQHTC